MSTDTSIGAPFAVPGGWECLPLDQLVDRRRGISYGIVQPGSHEPSGVPIVRVGDVRNGRVDVNDVLRVASEIESAHERTRLQGGEVLLSLVGTLGECAVAPEHLRGWNVARAIGVIPLATGTNPDWVAICLRSSPVQALMKAWSTTTVQATLNLREVRRLPILMPPALLRAQITETVCALEDKIEQNRRTAQALERLARAIFRAWFVEFEPVKAKAAGATAFPSMPQHVFDALPTRLVDSMIGPLPMGWAVQRVIDAAHLTMGQSPRSEHYNEVGNGMPFHQGVTNYGFRFPTHRVYCTVGGRMAEPKDVLLSVRAPVGRINVADRRLVLGRGIAGVRSRSGRQTFLLHQLFCVFGEEDSVGDGTIFNSVTKQFLAEMQILSPTDDAQAAFEKIVEPLDELVASTEIELGQLVSTRDYLIPRLLTGQIRAESA